MKCQTILSCVIYQTSVMPLVIQMECQYYEMFDRECYLHTLVIHSFYNGVKTVTFYFILFFLLFMTYSLLLCESPVTRVFYLENILTIKQKQFHLLVLLYFYIYVTETLLNNQRNTINASRLCQHHLLPYKFYF